MNIEQIKESLAFYRTAQIPGTGAMGIPAAIWGPPGLGKSEGVAQFAAAVGNFWDGAAWRDLDSPGAVLVDERMSTTDPLDWRGMARDTDEGVQWSIPDTFKRLWSAHNSGRPSVLFLDEWNVGVQPSHFAIGLQLTLDRRVGPQELPPSTYVCVAGNQPGESSGAQPIPEANANRIAHLEAHFCLDTWGSWALDHGVDPRVLAFAKLREALLAGAAKLDAARPAPGVQRREMKKGFLTPRSLSRLSPLLAAPARLLLSLASGVIGEADAAEFAAFIQTWKAFPTFAEIVAAPTSAQLPPDTQASIMFALSTMLAKRIDRASIGAAMAYIGRLPRDWQVFVIVTATRRDPTLRETREVIAWIVENQDVALA